MISRISRERRGPVRSGPLPLTAIVLITTCSAPYFVLTRRSQPTWEGVPRAAVRRVSFDACLTAGGVAQCPRQTVVKCQLENLQIKSKGSSYFAGGASTILDIIANGTTVKEGDVLCTLDPSEYEELAHPQTIRVEQHRAEMVQTEKALQSAELALREYREGLFAQDIQEMQGRLALAESQMKRAADRLAWSERMAGKGYTSLMQVANDREVLLRSTAQWRQAQADLDTYRRHTAPKIILSLEAEVVKARRMFDHEASDFRKSQAQLAHYRALIERCTIRVPHDGFAIYANGSFREQDERWRIEPGASVRQGQELFYLPDLSRMEVVAMLHDTVVDRVRRGMPARVRVEGMREVALEGHVKSVASLPSPSFNDVPYYACLIALDVTPPGLLPGISAEVEVRTGLCRDVLAVPPEAVSVDHDRNVCYVIGPSGLERREITPGLSSPNLIEVTDGLNEGEFVALNPPGGLDRSPPRPDSNGPDRPEMAALAALRRPTSAPPGGPTGGRASNDRLASPGAG
jgi:HlyD family secretion protein